MQAKYRSKLFQPVAHALALEQRILFDGAAAAAVDQQHHDSTAAEAKDTAKPATAVEARAQAAAPAQAAPRNLVVIDARLENRDQLAANLPVGTTALVVDAGQDAIAAISNALTQLGKVDSIQIFSHGATGQFTLGNQTFTSQSVDQLGERLSAWRGELNAGADIQLYGCDTGSGAAGQALVNELARWTGADVGASSNATGSTSAGGDWNLEVRAGDVDKSIALSADTLVSFQGLLADASPTVALGSGGSTVRLGDTFTFDVIFSNPSTQVGYAPYIDLFMPATGRDGNDGATFVSATYLGQAVNQYVLTFDVNGNATHPLAKDANGNALVINAASVGMKPGDQMVVLQLPYASVTSGQPAIDIQITAQLSNLADTSYSDGAPNLTINARGGFEYGNDSLNNPAQDPTLVEAALHSFVVTPTLLSVTQTVNMPEGETVTGPNFTRTETVTVTPATGQTLNNVTVTQTVPDQVHVSSITPGAGGTLASITLHDGTVLTNPTLIAAALNNPNAFVASYTIHYDTLTGPSTTQVGFYVPEIDAAGRPVLDPATGNPRTITFGTATVSGDWNPLDPRDRPTDPDGYPFTVTGDGAGITFVAKSITLLKTVNLQTDVGTPGITPGDTLRYTMEVDISDFYAFGKNILGQGTFTVTDQLSDGQTFSAANAPSIVIQQHGASQVIPVIYTATVNADGSTTLVFDIGASIAAAVQGPGLYALFGDLWDDDVQEGATRMSIVYDATIDTTYTSDHPPHDQLNEGDSVSNNAVVDATVLRDAVNIGGEQTDGSGTTSTIDTSNIDITLTQVNGGNPPANGELRPGDVVTFTITYDLLVADYENFKLTAYLPLPLLNATGINWSIGNGVGQWSFGPGNSILDVPDSVTTGAGNSIIFDFGNYVSGGLNGGTVQVRFTMVVGDQPYADQRELDVLAQSSQTTTIDKTPLISSDVAVIESVAEPVLDIKHGVVSTTNGTVTGTTGTWAQPGTTGTPFSGSVTSLAAVDGNVSGIDGADTLRLATAIKNSGGGNAFDVATSITLPAGLAFVGGSLAGANLQIYRGDGALLQSGVDYTVSGNSITFIDRNGQGALLAGRAGAPDGNDAAGRNVVVITYDVTVSNAILASSTLQSSSALTNYASVEGGQDFTPVDIVEVANQQVAAPTISKTYKDGSLSSDDSSATHTSGSNLAIGETMTYDIVITLPEGSTANLRLDDLIPPGLRLDLSAFGGAGYQIIYNAVNNGSDPFSGALAQNFSGTITVASFSADGSDGGDVRLVFSAANPAADNNTGNNAFVIRLVLVANNIGSNQQGVTLNNGAQLTYSDPDGDTPNGTVAVDRSLASSQQPGVTIVEPTLSVTQKLTTDPLFGGFGENAPITWDITISNSSGTDAFDLSFLDNLPVQISGMTITNISGAAAGSFVIVNGVLQTSGKVDLANGGSIVISLSGVVNDQVGTVPVMTNKASVQWTSLDGIDSGERNGTDGILASGVLNDYSIDNTLLIPVSNQIQISRVGGMQDTPPPTNASGVVDTSAPVEQVAVGEVIRYRVAVQIASSATGNTNYQIVIDLAPGLEFLAADLNKILIAFVSSTQGGLNSSNPLLDANSVAGLWVQGNQLSDIARPIDPNVPVDPSNPGSWPGPTVVLDPSLFSIAPTSSPTGGQRVTINLGTLTNTEQLPADTDIEGVVIDFNVRVRNILSNQAGSQLGMQVSEYVDNNSNPRGQSGTVYETVVEPGFSDPSKSVIDLSLNPGNSTDATLEVSFQQNGNVPAYDVHLQDKLPNGSNYQFVSVTISAANGTSATYTAADFAPGGAATLAGLTLNIDANPANGIGLDIARLNVGDKVSFRYSVTVPDSPIANNAASSAVLTWTSLPQSFTSWGGSAVGSASSATGERTGDDGPGADNSVLNNYVKSVGIAFGMVRGTLWNDTASATGSATPDGPGLAGQTVTLTWAGANGIFGDADDEVLGSTTTDANGEYVFGILPAGAGNLYRIEALANISDVNGTSGNQLRVRIDSDGSANGNARVELSLDASSSSPQGEADFGYVHINEAPINTVSDQSGAEDTVLHIGGLAVSDVDAGNGQLTITLSVLHGVLWISATAPAADATPPTGASTQLVLTGTLAQLNVLLSQLYYKGNQDFNTFRDPETLTMVTNDQGNFGDSPGTGDGIPGQNPTDALSDTDEMNIVIAPVNDAPIAHPDIGIAVEAGGLNNADPGVNPTGNVLDNDSDVDIDTNNDVIRVVRLENADGGFVLVPAVGVVSLAGRYGTLYITATGGYQYEVDNNNTEVQALRSAGDVLRESFGYFIEDIAGLGSSTSLTIDIHGANDTPVAQNDTGAAIEAGGTNNGTPGSDATGNVLDNDSDVDAIVYGETKAVSLVRFDGTGGGAILPVAPGSPTTVAGLYGSLTINSDGTYRYVVDNNNPVVQARSPSDPLLSEQFTYQVTDKGGLSAIATLTITIQGANDAPVAVDDHGSATAGASDGSPAPVNASGNVITGNAGVGTDTDVDTVDRPNADKLKVDGVRSGLESAGGTLTGVTSGITTNITGTVARLANGTLISGNFGQLSLGDDGTYTFVVNSADPAIQALTANQSLDVIFTYRIHDTGGLTDQAQLVITVTGVNDPPVVNPVSVDAIEAGGLLNNVPGLDPSGSIRSSYSDPDGDPVTISGYVNFNGTAGTLGQSLAGRYGSLVLDAQGNYRYVVDNNNALVQALRTNQQTLSDVFQYTVTDGNGKFVTASFSVVIHGRNDTPIAVDDTGDAIEAGGTNNATPGAPATGNVMTNDVDVDGNIYGESRTLDALRTGTRSDNGVFLSLVNGTRTLAGSYGSLTLNADGTYTYVVNDSLAAVQALKTGDSLTEVFTYRMHDTDGANSIAQLTITIAGRYDAPVANDDINYAVANLDGSGGRNPTGNVITGIGLLGGVFGADTDVDAGDHMRVTTIAVGPEGAQVSTVTVTPGSPQTIAGAFGTLVINADGSYQYFVDNTNADIIALGPLAFALESFTYQVTDDGGLHDQATLIILVRGQNQPPDTAPDFGTAVEDGGLHNNVPGSNPSGNVLANDTDPDTITTIPQDVMHVASYWAGDGPPPANAAAPGQSLRGQYGTLTINDDGSWSYELDNSLAEVEALRASGQTLQDKFTYLGADIWGGATPGLLTITIDGRNDTPIASDDNALAVEAGGVNNGTPGVDPRGNVLDNDTDVDGVQYGETKTVVYFTNQNGATTNAGNVLQGLYGKLTINADGSYEYRVDNDNPTVQAMRSANEKLQEVFTYRMRDTAGASSDARLTVVIDGANDNPVARDDSNSATDQTPAPQASGNVLPNDSDVDGGDSLSVTGIRTGQETDSGTRGVVGQPIAGRYGTLVLNADGSYTYSIDLSNREVLAAAGLGQVLKDYFTYTISDLAGATDDAVLTITLDIATPYIPPGPHFDRFGDDGRPYQRIPDVSPAIFVQPVVERIDERLSLSNWGADGSNIRFFATAETDSPSLGAQLGEVRGQFVARAVAESRRAAALDQAWVEGRHGVISLTADGLLPDPSVWAPFPADMLGKTEKAQTAPGFRAQLRDAAQRRSGQ
ncbi:VCBS domain-containing protein [Pseudomonas nitroreducens]|uniref:VCBS domain-containing protein n=1 Tax=Pseudomonas nitroreducens TaxID=46680 RepID=UPI0020A0FA7A|nr:VCBS domain-containing protein [Pseudomonas nitroreducens]MCP1625187.1 putative repeat protein (TIGR01451 family) [Pseudomonas nitroreducens]